MNADFLRQGSLPVRVFAIVGIVAGGLVGALQLFDRLLEPYDQKRASVQALVQEFGQTHAAEWSRVDLVSNAVFERFKDAPVSDAETDSWRISLVTSFDQDAREQFIQLELFFENVLSCVDEARCDQTTALIYFESPICIFWNKTWPYFVHLHDRGVLFRGGVLRFVDQRDCRDVELQALAVGKTGFALNASG